MEKIFYVPDSNYCPLDEFISRRNAIKGMIGVGLGSCLIRPSFVHSNPFIAAMGRALIHFVGGILQAVVADWLIDKIKDSKKWSIKEKKPDDFHSTFNPSSIVNLEFDPVKDKWDNFHFGIKEMTNYGKFEKITSNLEMNAPELESLVSEVKNDLVYSICGIRKEINRESRLLFDKTFKQYKNVVGINHRVLYSRSVSCSKGNPYTGFGLMFELERVVHYSFIISSE